MKKVVLAIICLVGFTVVGSAQFFEVDSIFRNKLIEGSLDQDFEVHIKLTGEYKKMNVNYTWRREVISVESDWTTAICDANVCHGAAVSTSSYKSDSMRNDDMIVHFYMPDNSGGKGSVRIILKNDSTNVEDTAVFSINVWNQRLNIETANSNNISVYPNPFNDLIKVSSGTNIASIEIVTLTGKVVKSLIANGVAEVSLDVKDLPSGLYLVKVKNTGGVVKTTKVSKTD
jgi:hypothetical protein